MVSGWKAKGRPGWYASQWEQVTAPAQYYSIPYAAILGNHDSEGDLSRRKIVNLDIETGNRLSYTQQGPSTIGGASNYFLDIFPPGSGDELEAEASSRQPSRNNATETVASTYKMAEIDDVVLQYVSPAARFWFFDSGDRGCAGISGGWGCVASSTVHWANTTAPKLPNVPISMAFVHIPVPESLQAWLSPRSVGIKGESCNCPSLNTGLFGFIRGNEIGAVWSGHDHSNDYEGFVDGVRVGYGRKAGYGSYTTLKHGARIVELKLGQRVSEAETWITLGNGEREEQVETMRIFSRPQEQCMSGAQEWRHQVTLISIAIIIVLLFLSLS